MRVLLILSLQPLLALTRTPGPERAAGPINTAFNLGNASAPTSHAECVWRRGMDRDACPDPDVHFYLYTSQEPSTRKTVVLSEKDWLRLSGWEPAHENVILVHGYAGGDQHMPMPILREAYLLNGSYNVFFVDWGALVRPPCYPAAVHNLRPVARCAADMFTFLRDSGLPVGKTTCIGHSLGAHVCGLMAGYLNFRIHKIIGLDPARPLIRPQNKLSVGDASIVQVIHTNAGHYGEIGRGGHVDFCVNGGRQQPYCEDKFNPDLCSHVSAVCYLAESIDPASSRTGTPCSRRCPAGSELRHILNHSPNLLSVPVFMGQHTPKSAVGSYCVSNRDEPYCPRKPGDRGVQHCCQEPHASQALLFRHS